MINKGSNTSLLKRRLITEIMKLHLDNKIPKNIDRIPLKMVKEKKDSFRCCRYRDQAILKYRAMAVLGHAIENESDELTTLTEYAEQTCERKSAPKEILTVITEGCSACPGAKYYVSEICRGCVARPCETSCPKDAVKIINGRSIIDDKKCIKCGKCAKQCPYGAISRIPVPCEDICPVGAISKDDEGRERINFEKCIYCGKCMKACPFGAITEVSQLADVVVKLLNKEPLAALYAPSIAGQIPGSLEQINEALFLCGFKEVREVAEGANLTILEEGKELQEKLASGETLMTTSCCPAYVEAVKKHVPELLSKVSHTPSPMEFIGRKVKAENPELTTVFIGPCTAKKAEAQNSNAIDYVISFEELGGLLMALDIDILELKGIQSVPKGSQEGRLFPIVGGVFQSVIDNMEEAKGVKAINICGLEKKSINLLRAYAKGKAPGNFLEVMACQEGCIGGPSVICPTSLAQKKSMNFAQEAKPLKGSKREI